MKYQTEAIEGSSYEETLKIQIIQSAHIIQHPHNGLVEKEPRLGKASGSAKPQAFLGS